MSNQQPIPLMRIKLVSVPLHCYEKVVLRKEGILYLGNVVSHLDLEDWVVMNGYWLGSFAGKRDAVLGETTQLHTHNPRGVGEKRHKTVVGMPAVRDTIPPPSSNRIMTMMGIPIPAVSYGPTIRPTPIKIIKP